jgi:hypothetical protein
VLERHAAPPAGRRCCRRGGRTFSGSAPGFEDRPCSRPRSGTALAHQRPASVEGHRTPTQ